VKQNLGSLQSIVGFQPVEKFIDDRLVTNTLVPLTYLTSLPVQASKIGPLDKVLEKATVPGTRRNLQ
jgi:hypothetical protein